MVQTEKKSTAAEESPLSLDHSLTSTTQRRMGRGSRPGILNWRVLTQKCDADSFQWVAGLFQDKNTLRKKVFRAARCWYLKQHLGTDNCLDSIMPYAHYGVIVDPEVRTGVSKHFDSRTTMGCKI